MKVKIEVPDAGFLAGIVIAHGVRIESSPEELTAQLRALVQKRSTEEFPPAHIKEGIRTLLKRGGFKPSGRNKPASEYLAQAAREDRFPFINNLVDINNLLSLESGLPVSILDLGVFNGHAVIRYGNPGEKYVFNNAGQEIDLAGLICVCRNEGDTSTPLGNAIKDSMLGKLKPETNSVIGVIYSDQGAASKEQMQRYVDEFASLLKRFGHASTVEALVLPGLSR